MHPAPELCPSPYAGRNQIPHATAAGRGIETDGGSARETEWGPSYSFRIGSIRDDNDSRQAFSAV